MKKTETTYLTWKNNLITQEFSLFLSKKSQKKTYNHQTTLVKELTKTTLLLYILQGMNSPLLQQVETLR